MTRSEESDQVGLGEEKLASLGEGEMKRKKYKIDVGHP